MDSLSDVIKNNAVKINCGVCGVDKSPASGIVYVTPNLSKFNYVLSSKHLLQQDSETEFNIDEVEYVEILYSKKGVLNRLERLNFKEVKKRVIDFNDDLVIILIAKNPDINFNTIFVSDNINKKKFYSWTISSANENELQKYDYNKNDPEQKRFKLEGYYDSKYLPGMSGGGIFSASENTLFGIIVKYPNKKNHNGTIDCVGISFASVNERLDSLGFDKLDDKSSKRKRQIGQNVVDIHQATINGVCLDLELARKRLKSDIKDDWFYDPLSYIDLLNQDYLFDCFGPHFNKNNYKVSQAEQFYVPKRSLTQRLSLVLPFSDRLIYIALVGVLADKLDKSQISNVYSARYNNWEDNQLIINGVEQWKKMNYQLSSCVSTYKCLIEIDVLNFYDNINKKLLIEKIQRVCETENEKKAVCFLEKILKDMSKKQVGLPQNSDASSLLASFYLNQVDVYMQYKAPKYYRFMDDIRIFCDDKYEARRLLSDLEIELRRCYLTVNSQKTKILEIDLDFDSKYTDLFNLKYSKLNYLRQSGNYTHRNEAFHISVKMLENHFNNENSNTNSDKNQERDLSNSLNTFSKLAVNGFWGSDDAKLNVDLEKSIEALKDSPWNTKIVCNLLFLLPTIEIKQKYWDILLELVMNEKYNIYTMQSYQIWLLLAKHKYSTSALTNFAVNSIERNDETIRPTIAAMFVYMCSIDENYKRIFLRKYGEGFTHGYMQNRLALICLRSFPSELIPLKYTHPKLSMVHKFLHKYKDQKLVYIHGASDECGFENEFEQLYSL